MSAMRGTRPGGNALNVSDHLSDDGARLLARKIEEYWKLKGCNVTVHRVCGGTRSFSFVSIRSNMIDGLPMRMKAGSKFNPQCEL